MKDATVMFLILVIVASTLFVAAANAATNPIMRTPANTGFAGQGQFRQGMQTGIPAQGQGMGQAGGFAGGAINAPAGTGLGQPGAGIVAGDRPGSSSPTGSFNPAGSIGGGGPGTCYCIRAPCDCGGTSGGTGPITGGQLPTGGRQYTTNPQLLNQPVQGQPVQTQPLQTQQFQQPLQTQTFQGQSTQPLTAPAGGIQPRQF